MKRFKAALLSLMFLDGALIAITISYLLYLNFIAANGPFFCQAIAATEQQYNRTWLLNYIDNSIINGKYAYSACLLAPFSVVSQSYLNQLNISYNITQLRNLANQKAFWYRSSDYVSYLIAEMVFMAVLTLLYRRFA